MIEKLFALGLVSDRAELYKRRSRKGKAKNPWEAGADDAPIVDDWSDEEAAGGSRGGGSDREVKDNSSDSDSSKWFDYIEVTRVKR